MKRLVLATALAAALAPVPGGPASSATCPADRAPAAIAATADAGQKCQDAIAKESAKYAKTKLKALAKCKLKEPAGTCPTTKDQQKILKAVDQATTKIAKACGDDAAQAALGSAWGAGTDEGLLASCLLSQNSVEVDLVSAFSHGATTEPWPGTGKDRAACVKELSKQGSAFLDKALATAHKCLKKQGKQGAAGDLAALCVGSIAAGAFVPPTDAKTAQSLTKLMEKTESKIAKKCGKAEAAGEIATLFACPGSQSVEDLQNCIVCSGWDAYFAMVDQQFSETGSVVANGPGALQAAVDAATAGDKLLIEPGDYQEEVTVATNDLALVGCGGASDDRPRVIPPEPQATGRGIQANGVDGLRFQSLDFFDQDNDHIRVGFAEGVSFRDIHGDGNRNTAYAVFPVESNDVLVELSRVSAQDDAPVYVGRSSTGVIRFNDVRNGVAGIELENAGNMQTYGNYATRNTAGILVFKDGTFTVQISECHAVHHNLLEDNNEPNFGTGNVGAVPAGTGMLVLSSDTTPYAYNISRGNGTVGLIVTDQVVAAFGPPFSADQSVDDNFIYDNWFEGNGASPDFGAWPFGTGADVAFAASESAGNCASGNLFDSEIFFTDSITSGANLGACATLPPPPFATCPAPPVDTDLAP